MIDKILASLAAALPGLLKLFALFKKKDYTSQDVDKKSRSELDALNNWKRSSEGDRKLIKGDD